MNMGISGVNIKGRPGTFSIMDLAVPPR